ncbi:MAG: DUF4294 domain-containing protein [Candidatus Cryptobacteroides sp.]
MKKFLLISMIILCAGVYAPAQDFNMQEEEYYLDELPPASVSGKRKKKVKKYGKEWREKYRLVYNFNKVYPYALVGRKMMQQVDSTIEADNLDKRNRDKYIKNVEKELFRLFEEDIRHTTVSQGFLLTRLVDRECGMTVYDIIYNYEGGLSAGFWNLVGKIFDQDLKAHYDPEGKDAPTEELVKIWESGEKEWADFYYQIFWEEPPKTVIKTERLSTKSFIKD